MRSPAVLNVSDGVVESCSEGPLAGCHGGDGECPTLVVDLPYRAHHGCCPAPEHLQDLQTTRNAEFVVHICWDDNLQCKRKNGRIAALLL